MKEQNNILSSLNDQLQRWQFFKIICKEIGITEIKGEQDHPRILQYFKACGHQWVKNDELAWCSAFANAVAIWAGFESTGKLNARSWLDVGQPIDFWKAELTDVVVFHRKGIDSPYGHVGFFVSWHPNLKYVNIISGNSNNMVRLSAYEKSKILGIRRLMPVSFVSP